MRTQRSFALVTGASSGIGFELARQFAGDGYDLLITSNDGPELEQARQTLDSEFPEADISSATLDLSIRDSVEKLMEAVRRLGRPLDALAANAGAGISGPFKDTSLDDEVAMIEINVVSQVRLIKMVLKDMAARGHGKILITSSLIALSPGPFMAIYAATKAFLHSFGLAIRNELQESPITVTVLMPGATDTEFWERAGMTDTNIAQQNNDDPADVAREGYQALKKGSAYVVTGAANKVRAGLAAVTPATALAQANRDKGQPSQ